MWVACHKKKWPQSAWVSEKHITREDFDPGAMDRVGRETRHHSTKPLAIG